MKDVTDADREVIDGPASTHTSDEDEPVWALSPEHEVQHGCRIPHCRIPHSPSPADMMDADAELVAKHARVRRRWGNRHRRGEVGEPAASTSPQLR